MSVVEFQNYRPLPPWYTVVGRSRVLIDGVEATLTTSAVATDFSPHTSSLTLEIPTRKATVIFSAPTHVQAVHLEQKLYLVHP